MNLPRGTKSYLHASNKKARRNFDADKLDYIQNNIGLPCLREQELYNTRYTQAHHKRSPDLIINKRVICEHDTFAVHGEINAPNDRTLKRNIDHCLGNLPWFVIHEDLAKQLGLDEAKLATYLYYHTLGQELAREKALELVQY